MPIPIFHTLHQPAKGYRYGIDSFLLVRFMKLLKTDSLCDLGTGIGIIGLLALQRKDVKNVVALEIQEEFVKDAKKNIELLGLSDRMEVLHKNWKEAQKILPRASFDVVVSNPPYRKKQTGKIPPDPKKAIAKHEISGTMEDLIESGKFLLKKSGRFYLMYPPLRLEECLRELNRAELKVQRMSFIHSYQDQPAKLFMVEAVKSEPRELHVEAPVILYKDPDHYTLEVEEWMGKKVRK